MTSSAETRWWKILINPIGDSSWVGRFSQKRETTQRTFCGIALAKVRLSLVHNLLNDDCKAVDIASLSAVDRTLLISQEFRCHPEPCPGVCIYVNLIKQSTHAPKLKKRFAQNSPVVSDQLLKLIFFQF
jgi:hypothetical protein